MGNYVARVGTRPRVIDPESSLAAQPPRMAALGSLKPREPSTRRYLSAAELDKLIAAVRRGRHGVRDATLLLLAYRHDLPLRHLLTLRWERVDFKRGVLRTGGWGRSGALHALRGRELGELRRMARDYAWYPQVFNTDGGAPLEGEEVVRMLTQAAATAKLGFAVHPHMLRHSCGVKRDADARHVWSFQQYLGHRNVRRVASFADSAPRRFT